MIAVIADDFTGAAEIGGIGLRRGMKVQMETDVEEATDMDLLIIATDTRSLSGELAKKEIEKITQKLIALKPTYIFKKLDSVLRGNIYDELDAQIKSSEKKRALVIAGNPNFKRIIENGIYTVAGVPLGQTSFAHDPEFPSKSSNVKEIVGKEKDDVFSLNVEDDLPEKGIVIGDVRDETDMLLWTKKVDEHTIVAGGSGFFDILLRGKWPKYQKSEACTYALRKKSLFIFGSTFPKDDVMMVRFKEAGVHIMNMPLNIYKNKDFSDDMINKWAEEVAEQIRCQHKVVITISHQSSTEQLLSVRLRENIGLLVSKIFKQVKIDDLLIEGGATTSMVLKYLNVKRLFPYRELDFGVIQMRVNEYPDLCLITKPGSYSWPECVLLNQNDKKAKI